MSYIEISRDFYNLGKDLEPNYNNEKTLDINTFCLHFGLQK